MSSTPEIVTVDTEDDYVHVRFRDPKQFDEIRTPDWAENTAQSVSDGAKVRTGKQRDSDDWQVEAVLIEKNVGEDKAKEQATKIVEAIERESLLFAGPQTDKGRCCINETDRHHRNKARWTIPV